MDIIEKVKDSKLISKGDRLVLGLSGGSDSLCLLNILLEIREEYNINIIAVHINHMIREEAEEDEEAVKKLCASCNVEFYSRKVDIMALAKEKRISTEDAGRICRYEYFNEILSKTNSNKIVTAHNLNDVVETVFMNIIRGTGLNGLTGIENESENIIRPLLNVSKEEIEEYCETNNLPVRIDKTNFENDYTRNKIRNIIIPAIKKEINEAVNTNVINMVNILKEEEQLLNDIIKQEYQKIKDKVGLKKVEIINKPKALQRRILREYILEVRGSLKDISLNKIDEVLEFVRQATTGKRLDIIEGYYLEISYNNLIVKSGKEKNTFCYALEIPGSTYIPELNSYIIATIEKADKVEDIIKDKKIKAFDIEKVGKKLYVRSRHEGDRFSPSGMRGSKKLKDFFIDLKVSRDERDRVPLITNEKEIIWVVGMRGSSRYRRDKNSKEVVCFEYKKDV